jgi:hypothetical protein
MGSGAWTLREADKNSPPSIRRLLDNVGSSISKNPLGPRSLLVEKLYFDFFR